MGLPTKTIDSNVPVKRWPFDYSTEEIKNSLGSFEQEYQQHATGELVHNDILGFAPAGVIEWLVDDQVIINRDGSWFINYYPYHQSWRHRYDAMRELQSRRAYAKRMELKQLDNKHDQMISGTTMMTQNSQDDLEWEENNGIRVDDIPF